MHCRPTPTSGMPPGTVQGEFSLSALTYNLLRAINLMSVLAPLAALGN